MFSNAALGEQPFSTERGGVFVAYAIEAAQALDALTSAKQGFAVAIAETVQVLDAPSTTQGFGAAVKEAAEAKDTPQGYVVFAPIQVLEGSEASDITAFPRQTLAVLIIEGATAQQLDSVTMDYRASVVEGLQSSATVEVEPTWQTIPTENPNVWVLVRTRRG